jgi:multisubunit Na+/H+ antiporter MnhG subunit|tara:strand:+ start:490 stop:663 length:174 start_codon:yes stop_codon:yes gene_type:complete
MLRTIGYIVMFYITGIVGFWAFLDFMYSGDKVSFWATVGASAIVIGLTVTINDWLTD